MAQMVRIRRVRGKVVEGLVLDARVGWRERPKESSAAALGPAN